MALRRINAADRAGIRYATNSAWGRPDVDRERSRDDWPQTIPFEQTFHGLYGLEILELGEVRATGMVRVRDAVRQPIGLVHGGVYTLRSLKH